MFATLICCGAIWWTLTR